MASFSISKKHLKANNYSLDFSLVFLEGIIQNEIEHKKCFQDEGEVKLCDQIKCGNGIFEGQKLTNFAPMENYG